MSKTPERIATHFTGTPPMIRAQRDRVAATGARHPRLASDAPTVRLRSQGSLTKSWRRGRGAGPRVGVGCPDSLAFLGVPIVRSTRPAIGIAPIE